MGKQPNEALKIKKYDKPSIMQSTEKDDCLFKKRHRRISENGIILKGVLFDAVAVKDILMM